MLLSTDWQCSKTVEAVHVLQTARTRRMRFQLDVMSPRVLGQL